MSTSTALRGGRLGSVAAAALIAIGLTLFVNDTFGIHAPGLFFAALGIGLFAAYFNRPQASNLVVPAGILTGLGLGITLVEGTLTPGFLHGPLMFGSLAAGFTAIYLFGDRARHRWAMYPAGGMVILAWLTFVTQAPWLKDTFGAISHYTWPLLIVAAGLWLIERGREPHNTHQS